MLGGGCGLVAKSCLTLCDLMDCHPPGSSVHGISQARILEWVAMPSSRRSSWPRNWTWVSGIAGRFFTAWAPREALSCSLRTFKTKHAKSMGASIWGSTAADSTSLRGWHWYLKHTMGITESMDSLTPAPEECSSFHVTSSQRGHQHPYSAQARFILSLVHLPTQLQSPFNPTAQ